MRKNLISRVFRHADMLGDVDEASFRGSQSTQDTHNGENSGDIGGSASPFPHPPS